jgi:hypothetical protein
VPLNFTNMTDDERDQLVEDLSSCQSLDQRRECAHMLIDGISNKDHLGTIINLMIGALDAQREMANRD